MNFPNVVVVMGYLAGDPVVKTTPKSDILVHFILAVPRQTRMRYAAFTDYVRICCRGAKAEAVATYLKKGALVSVQGSIRSDKKTSPETIEGAISQNVDIWADKVIFLPRVEIEKAVQISGVEGREKIK